MAALTEWTLADDARAEIEARFDRINDSTLYEVLDLDRRATSAQIDAACTAALRRYDLEMRRAETHGAWRARLDAIVERVRYAYEVLGSPLRRAGYDAALGAPVHGYPREEIPRLDSIAPSFQPREVIDPTLLGSLLPPSRGASARPLSVTPLFDAMSLPPPPAPLDPESFESQDDGREGSLQHDTEAVLAEDRAPWIIEIAVDPNDASPVPGESDEDARPSANDAMQAVMRLARERHLRERGANAGKLRLLAEQATARGDHADAARVMALIAKPGTDTDRPANVGREEASAGLLEAQRQAAIARAHEQERRWEDAAKAWCAAQQALPHEDALRRRASTALARAAQSVIRTGTALPKALELARAAVQLANDNVIAHIAIAQVFLLGGLKPSARRALDAALALDPESETARDLMKRL